MKQKYVLISLGLAGLIFIYSLYFIILPLRQSIQSLEVKTRLLTSQHTAQTARNKGQAELNTEVFYHWFLLAHFQNLKIQSLIGNPRGLKVKIIGPSPDLMKFLESLTESQFTHLKLSNIHEIAQLQINFTSLKFATLSPEAKSKSSVPVPKKTSSIILGQVHKQGECFDVIILGGHSTLRKNPKC